MHILMERIYDADSRHHDRNIGRSLPLSVFSVLSVGFALLCAPGCKEHVDLVVTNGTVVTMDAQRRVIENGAVAVRGDSIVAVGPSAEIARAIRCGEDRRCARGDCDAGADQRARARGDELVSGHGGRSGAGRLAEEIYFSGGSAERHRRFRGVGHAAGHAGNDARRDHDLRGYVLLRGRRGAGDERSGDARRAGRDDHRFSGAGQ